MTKNSKLILYFLYGIMWLAVIILYIFQKINNNTILFYLVVTLFTTLFHFSIRFTFANLLYKLIEKKCRFDAWWFREKKFEKQFYKILMVKKWKDKLPTWVDNDFNPKSNNGEKLLYYMCKAEVYHLFCVILSFVPLLFSLKFGEFWIFFWTSVGAAVFDLLFIIIQRYNRPRVLKLLQRKTNSSS